jgi:probable FeS assembly SUF system protein SufT
MNTQVVSTPLRRDCDAVQVPSGATMVLKQGTEVIITQSLGGAYTVVAKSGGMYRIANQDLDAIGIEVPKTQSPPEATATPPGPVDEQKVWEQLKTCFDPEIPVNIVDLGLIYDMRVVPLPSGTNRVEVKMTLTAPGCGMGPSIAADAKSKILTVPGVAEADVQLVWEPQWNPQMISPDGKAKLGMA